MRLGIDNLVLMSPPGQWQPGILVYVLYITVWLYEHGVILGVPSELFLQISVLRATVPCWKSNDKNRCT